jgi:hypothetical protein
VIKGYFDDSRSDGEAWTVAGYVAWFNNENDRFIDSSVSPSRTSSLFLFRSRIFEPLPANLK